MKCKFILWNSSAIASHQQQITESRRSIAHFFKGWDESPADLGHWALRKTTNDKCLRNPIPFRDGMKDTPTPSTVNGQR
ncbi:hypothetical protein H6G41_00260 [Tolypothrix sp. FACHB-123]|uniref:hypothetical protein n=1 Tax=Tolypothrix sp. FACHB-123 TaxID=2692868 RepID=UPI0016858AA1|nr:hypothetical protein [Tolypothrix sp. FACHB-123]MBD2353067.1 hypothetical protein [Tolypothrix sp. FACHB-123]